MTRYAKKLKFVRLFTMPLIQVMLFVFIGVLSYAAPVFALPEDKIKAAYIYQLAHFVTWPDKQSAEKTLTICIFGKDDIINELSAFHMIQDGNSILKVMVHENIEDTFDCKIIYISNIKDGGMRVVLDRLHNKPILTVSSVKNFVREGGMIGFVSMNNTIGMEINHTSALYAGLNLNAKLLEVANTVIAGTSGSDY